MVDHFHPIRQRANQSWLHGSVQGIKSYMHQLHETYNELKEATKIRKYTYNDVIPRFSEKMVVNETMRLELEVLDISFNERSLIYWYQRAKMHFNSDQLAEKQIEEYFEFVDGQPKKMVEGSDVWSCTTLDALKQILKDRLFKPMFETTRYNDKKHINDRKIVEKMYFGYDLSMDAAERPIYGYLSRDPNGRNRAAVHQYGPIAICFKNDIKRRTTVFAGDTLVSQKDKDYLVAKPVLYDNPNRSMLPIDDTLKFNPSEHYHNANNMDFFSIYCEAQMHRGVTTSDIARIVAHRLRSDEIDPEIHRLVQDNNIPPISYTW